MTTIWVDADACPRPVKEILYRAADKRGIAVTFVANAPLQLPRSRYLSMLQVASGFDVADQEIIERINPGDLVITADIPLAALVVERGAAAIDPRGELYSTDNIRERLSLRNFMADLRSAGVQTSGAKAYSPQDAQAFANALDRWLTRHYQKT